MLKNLIFFFIISGMGSLSAQTFSGKLNPFPSDTPLKITASDTIKILAVMADFQEDNDAATFGNGKFGTIYSRDYGTSIIDPLPHDKSYFENHLLFVQNYFNKVSKGVVHVSFTVLPEVITVSKTMRNYSSPPQNESLAPVADFSREVWKKADSVYSSFQFSDYNFFIIFHAGVGRDISLPGSLGNERDLPSLYFSQSAFENIYPGFTGFPVNGGAFNITNTAIIPETESRELSNFGNNVLFEISINGLLAATLGSHLGLPDLFNTETGLSAIGRFGLMDGQAIFAYNGLFPPEPSAWEKIYLGWITPAEASLSKQNYSLVPGIASSLSDTTILKLNLSSTEYYLLENRQRDALNNFSVVTYVSNGETRTRVFQKDTTGYYSYSVDSLEGVIIDVDEYDWALPGNGILIWHIDENIISSKISDNKVNADPENRGVDVEEADGIQDIGVEFQTIFGDIIVGEGEQRDLWNLNNDSDLYENRFSNNTRPNTKTNSGANSLLTISDFSEISNRMSFNIAYGDSVISPVNVTRIPLGSQNPFMSIYTPLDSKHGFGADGNLYFYTFLGEPRLSDSLNSFTNFKTASYTSGDSTIIAGVLDGLNIYSRIGTSSSLERYPIPSDITTPPVFLPEQNKILAGSVDGNLYTYFSGNLAVLRIPGAGEIIQVAADQDYFSLIARKGNGYAFYDALSLEIELQETPQQLLLTKNSSGKYVNVISSSENIYIITEGKISSVINKQYSSSGIGIADLKQDGNNYILFTDGPALKAYNLNGFSAEYFPFTDPLKKDFDNFILAADFEGDKSSEVIAVTIDGRIFAIDGKTGKPVHGFPLSAGSRSKTHPVIFNVGERSFISVLDSLNNFYTWSVSSVPGTLFWSEKYGNPANTAFVKQAAAAGFVNEFFPKDRVYNYPNPTYDSRTSIRYYVSESSSINIKIFDIAGALVDELNSEASGGSDGETVWDVSGIQSGVYLARVEASSQGGRKETNFIKIAVIK